MNKQWFLVLANMLLLVTGCSEPGRDAAPSETAPALETLAGEAFYRERKYVPPGAKLHVTLEDVSRADASSTVIASSTTLLAGSQPYQFTLDYSPADIDARLQYSLRATITFYDDLLFASTRRHDPFANPDEPISIELKALSWPE
jgi:putative lipoprotein